MKVGIIGAGLQGEACANILARDSQISDIYLSDISIDKLEMCQKRINSGKVKINIVDAKNQSEVINFLKKCDICIDMTLPEYCPYIMKAALEVGIDYINTAYDTPFWENIVSRR